MFTARVSKPAKTGMLWSGLDLLRSITTIERKLMYGVFVSNMNVCLVVSQRDFLAFVERGAWNPPQGVHPYVFLVSYFKYPCL